MNRVGEETSHGLAYTRYTFTIDGLTFARYSRDQMQQAMRARGDSPATMQLEVSADHAQMTGDGELWVGADGLPLRQITRALSRPERRAGFGHILSTFLTTARAAAQAWQRSSNRRPFGRPSTLPRG